MSLSGALQRTLQAAAHMCIVSSLSRLFVIAGLMLSLAACVHKDLCELHPHTTKLRVEFDWRDAPLASPDGMCVFFYPEDGGEYRRFDFSGSRGGEVEIAMGRYRVLCYNNDTETVVFSGMSQFSTHSIMSYECDLFSPLGYTSPRDVPRAGEEELVVKTPEMMWGCTALDVEIMPSGITYTCVSRSDSRGWKSEPVVRDERVITLFPHELVCEYTLEVRNVENLKYASQMCGSITGMSQKLVVHDESMGEVPVTLPFECYVEDEKIMARFYTFGHNTELPNPHRIVLYIWMSDGKIYCYGLDSNHYDVTSQVHTAPDRRHVHLIIDGLTLPRPITNGSGLNPSIDDWEEENETIVM